MRFSTPNFKFELRPRSKAMSCPLLTLHNALTPTAQLSEVCGGNTLDSAEQFRACKVFFKARMGMQSFDRDSWKPHLQHCMGMMSSSACRQVLERAYACFYHL